MNSVFVTGANGFLGSNLIKTLLDKYPDVNITALIRDKSKSIGHLLYDPNIMNRINIVFGDILDYNLVERIISDYEIDTIFNLASVSIVRVCENNPHFALYVNVMGNANILEAARRQPTVKAICQFSSDKSYGTAEELPYEEDKTPLKGTRPYEATKTLIDIWSQMYAKNYDVPVAVIRSANLFGPGDPNMSRLIPQVCTSISKGKNPWLYEGVADYIREFVYVDDAVDFMINLVEKGEKNPELLRDTYNLGTGNTFSIKELVDRIISLTNNTLSVDIKQKQIEFQEIPAQYLSLTKSKEKLGWEATYVGDRFNEALIYTYNYYAML